jgi:dTDP-D-glucose 4,6-dehydratase
VAVDIILHRGAIGEIYNIGSDDELSVLDIARILVNEICGDSDIRDHIEFVADRPFNDKRYFINNEKLKQMGWKQEKYIYEEMKRLI